jgi:phage FluMu gp28-like protein
MNRLAPDSPLHSLSVAAEEAIDGGPPSVLLRYQQEWIDDRSPLKVGDKGRRVGLTWAEAADDVLDAMAEVDSCNTFYCSAAQDMAREYIEACAMWARAFDYLASEIQEGLFDDGEDAGDPAKRYIKTFELVFPKTGRRIVALSSRPTNLRGKQGNIVLDEAAFAPDLAGMLKAALAMLLWGNRVKVFSTHNGVDSPFNELIEQIKAGKRPGSLHHIPFSRAIADGLYRRVCLRRGIPWTAEGEAKWVAEARAFYGDDAAEELDAIPSASGGKYLSLALLAERMTVTAESGRCPIIRNRWEDAFAYQHEDVREFAIKGWLAEAVAPALARLDRSRRHTFGLDFARIADLSVLTILEEDNELVRRPRLVIELANCPFTSQDQIFWFVIDRLPRFRGGAADAGGNGAATAEKLAQRYGTEMVEQVKFTQGWYALNMPKLKGGLQDGTLRDLPRDEEHQSDLRAIEVVKGIPMVPQVNTASAAAKAAAAEGGAKKRRHGDYAISLCLAEYAFHREAGEIAWTPAPNPETLGDTSTNYHGAGQVGRMSWRPRHDDFQVGAGAFGEGVL